MLPSVNLNICKIHGVETKHQPAVTPVLLLSLRSFPENLAAQQWSYFQPHLHITQAVNMLHSLVYGQDDQASKSLVPSLQTVWNCQCKLIIYSLSKWKLHCLLQLQDFPNRFERVVSIRNPMGKWGMFFRRVFLGEIFFFRGKGNGTELRQTRLSTGTKWVPHPVFTVDYPGLQKNKQTLIDWSGIRFNLRN